MKENSILLGRILSIVLQYNACNFPAIVAEGSIEMIALSGLKWILFTAKIADINAP